MSRNRRWLVDMNASITILVSVKIEARWIAFRADRPFPHIRFIRSSSFSVLIENWKLPWCLMNVRSRLWSYEGSYSIALEWKEGELGKVGTLLVKSDERWPETRSARIPESSQCESQVSTEKGDGSSVRKSTFDSDWLLYWQRKTISLIKLLGAGEERLLRKRESFHGKGKII